MENGPFIDNVPIKTSIYKGFSMAMLNNQRVYSIQNQWTKSGKELEPTAGIWWWRCHWMCGRRDFFTGSVDLDLDQDYKRIRTYQFWIYLFFLHVLAFRVWIILGEGITPKPRGDFTMTTSSDHSQVQLCRLVIFGSLLGLPCVRTPGAEQFGAGRLGELMKVNELLHVVMSMYRGYLGWICLQLGSRDAMSFLRHSAI